MYKIKFYFYNLTSEYYWEKYLSDIDTETIENYLSKKKLPFELKPKDIKMKLLEKLAKKPRIFIS